MEGLVRKTLCNRTTPLKSLMASTLILISTASVMKNGLVEGCYDIKVQYGCGKDTRAALVFALGVSGISTGVRRNLWLFREVVDSK